MNKKKYQNEKRVAWFDQRWNSYFDDCVLCTSGRVDWNKIKVHAWKSNSKNDSLSVEYYRETNKTPKSNRTSRTLPQFKSCVETDEKRNHRQKEKFIGSPVSEVHKERKDFFRFARRFPCTFVAIARKIKMWWIYNWWHQQQSKFHRIFWLRFLWKHAFQRPETSSFKFRSKHTQSK